MVKIALRVAKVTVANCTVVSRLEEIVQKNKSHKNKGSYRVFKGAIVIFRGGEFANGSFADGIYPVRYICPMAYKKC